ncbi:hypothetical protein [Neosynechococcus sphagnicola]|uniref:hypothetical protein n=1 Tax=Neosynechococcus sphagnicola TaxID=1501145 RepID=UPI00138E404C|nr:hypothetical protein [Neosynechococcus sphagnicola]
MKANEIVEQELLPVHRDDGRSPDWCFGGEPYELLRRNVVCRYRVKVRVVPEWNEKALTIDLLLGFRELKELLRHAKVGSKVSGEGLTLD